MGYRPCSVLCLYPSNSVARRAQLYMTKVPLLVPFVEMLPLARARRSWGVGGGTFAATTQPVPQALNLSGSQAHLTLRGCAEHLELDSRHRENADDLHPGRVCGG